MLTWLMKRYRLSLGSWPIPWQPRGFNKYTRTRRDVI